jgi:phage terminase small subunit
MTTMLRREGRRGAPIPAGDHNLKCPANFPSEVREEFSRVLASRPNFYTKSDETMIIAYASALAQLRACHSDPEKVVTEMCGKLEFRVIKLASALRISPHARAHNEMATQAIAPDDLDSGMTSTRGEEAPRMPWHAAN